MNWFFRPKVQLGLFVNLVFVIFTLFSSADGGRPRVRVHPDAPAPVAVPYAPPPPPAAPSRAYVVESGGRVNVLLTDDLTLVKKPGRTLVLSPSFAASTSPTGPPPAVTLRFIIFSDEDACTGACMFVINADGAHVWESAARGTFSTGWTRAKIPATSTTLGDGQVARTLAAETLTTQIPYDTFFDIINAKRVVLSLGPDKAELTRDQIEALRDMHRKVAPPSEPRVKTF